MRCFSLEMILQTLPDPVFVISESGRYLAAYGGKDSRFYHDPGRLVGRQISDIMPEEKAHWFMQNLKKALADPAMHIVEYALSRDEIKGLEGTSGPDGILYFEARFQLLPEPVDGEKAVLWVATNISARYRLEQKLRVLSERDALTDVYNRRKMLQELDSHLERCKRYEQQASLVLIDLDYFKKINDYYGHDVGDKVLVAFTRLCQQHIRQSDILARMGGEEFLVLMPGVDEKEAFSSAERLRRLISSYPMKKVGCQLPVTISIGMSRLHPQDADASEALKRADIALYQAKRSGRNRVHIYPLNNK